MDRKFLESMGIEKENIDKILDQNMSEIGALNARIKTKDTEITTLRGDLTTANTKVAELEKVDVKDLQTQLTREREGREKDRKEFALRSVLSGAGCTDIDYLMYKLGDSVEFDDKGNLKDTENFVKTTKEQYAAQFQTAGPGGTGGTGNFQRTHRDKPVTVDDYKKMSYTDKLKLKTEQPDIYKTVREQIEKGE